MTNLQIDTGRSGGSGEVVVTDVRMPFFSMVVFMVKWVIASIPAFIILAILSAILSLVFGGFIGAFNQI